MGVHKWNDLVAKLPAKQRAQIEKKTHDGFRELIDMRLAELRKDRGLTQAELAKLAEMHQGDISDAERREDHLVSTLRRVVEALGGELEVAAVFGDRRVRLQRV